jgi:hypothetical protein
MLVFQYREVINSDHRLKMLLDVSNKICYYYCYYFLDALCYTECVLYH